MFKRSFLAALICVGVLASLFLLVISALFPSHTAIHAASNAKAGPVTTINSLTRISVVGNTALIIDAHKKTIAVDANPYGVAIVPEGVPTGKVGGSLKAGDIVVTNIGANDTGTTLVRFLPRRVPVCSSTRL